MQVEVVASDGSVDEVLGEGEDDDDAIAEPSSGPTSASARMVGSRFFRFLTRSAWVSLISRVAVLLNTRSLSRAVSGAAAP